jgi:hypothetical protein
LRFALALGQAVEHETHQQRPDQSGNADRHQGAAVTEAVQHLLEKHDLKPG